MAAQHKFGKVREKKLPTHAPEDYLHIYAWGRMMGSYHSYIVYQQMDASDDNAPIDAIYKRDGKWECYHEVTNQGTRHIIDRMMAEKHRTRRK